MVLPDSTYQLYRDEVAPGWEMAVEEGQVVAADLAHAPADQRDLVVDRERLVVHSAIYARETRYGVDCATAATAERIEDTNFEVGMRVQRCHAGVVAFREDIIEQQPKPNTA